MSRIHVYDEMMGSGKTSRAIERMQGYIKEDKKFIYIAPYLKEIERIREALPLESVKIPLSKDCCIVGELTIPALITIT